MVYRYLITGFSSRGWHQLTCFSPFPCETIENNTYYVMRIVHYNKHYCVWNTSLGLHRRPQIFSQYSQSSIHNLSVWIFNISNDLMILTHFKQFKSIQKIFMEFRKKSQIKGIVYSKMKNCHHLHVVLNPYEHISSGWPIYFLLMANDDIESKSGHWPI